MSGGNNNPRQNVTNNKEIDKNKLKHIAKVDIQDSRTIFYMRQFSLLLTMHLKPTSIFNMATNTGMAINLTVKPSNLH